MAANDLRKCQDPKCDCLVRLTAPYKGLEKDFRCAKCLQYKIHEYIPRKSIPANAYTTCNGCNAQFRLMKLYKGKSPHCAVCREGKYCKFCKSTRNVTWGADPYEKELFDDETPFYICAHCREERLQEI